MRSFASDNNSGVHPAIMEALTRANRIMPWAMATICGQKKLSGKLKKRL